ncbi:HlyD family secretion protein [Janthinobacterium fluminis]|uniref:HlyD family efflux transporter periplasmic adaptor subunit n=1 Tax=Janthinobacterium fluminis TaxID=2987524 RepID=A0ABT5K6L1_9BURK|nr:HlyD family efflux transporter periplasmic adaptor subunit [Janthinobacterium fluminis]MDC8760637.1 HlyD family efflux transporter periplasmic adaptor subunit [Janthinobacterium fluminis]
MEPIPIFRNEALKYKKGKLEGSVVFIRPISLPIFTFFAVCVSLAIIVGAIFGEFTNRTTVSGSLIPEGGIVKLYSQTAGVVMHKHFSDGDIVREGQVLYTIVGNRHTAQTADVERTLLEHAQSRITSSQYEISNIRELEKNERLTRNKKIKFLQGQLDVIHGQIQMQQKQIEIATNLYSRYGGLLAKGYVTKDHLNDKESALIEQKNRLASLERERESILTEISGTDGEIASATMRFRSQQEQAQRSLLTARQEAIELDSKREFILKAPVQGVITGVQIEIGQSIDPSRPLVTILPANGRLLAELYVPRGAIGFIQKDTVVNMQYEAYMYQKFGLHKGKVISISQVAIPSQELGVGSGGIPRKNNQMPAESYYRVTVSLNSQQVQAYGKPYELKPGIIVVAELDLETKKIYQWLFDPILSANGRLSSFLK